MITCKQIYSGKDYLKNHLSANDYYSEEETVIGYWYGKAAEMLGIHGKVVTPEAYEAIRTNRHPLTGDKLRPRDSKVRYHDMGLSVPKGYSIMALVAGDERLLSAFDRTIRKTFDQLEKFAEVRNRKGQNYNSEKTNRTGNAVAAVYIHDSSRLLDPQLHAHFLVGNLSWREERQQWLALQPATMMRESKAWIRKYFHQTLAKECIRLGHDIEWMPDKNTFRFTAISPEMEKLFSSRSSQKQEFRERYKRLFGLNPSNQRVAEFINDKKWQAVKRFKKEYLEHFRQTPGKQLIREHVLDWRSDKMATSVREKVREFQRERVPPEQIRILDEALVQSIRLSQEKMENSQAMNYQNMEQAMQTEESNLRKKKHGRHTKTYGLKKAVVSGSQKKKALKVVAKTKGKTMARVRLGMSLYHTLRGKPNALLAKQMRRVSRRKLRR